jgi:DUF4097 and DUF4098 domain-containing protein YvlB
MTHYEGERLELELDDVDELDVRIVAGEVTVSARTGDGPVRLEVDVLQGPPVEVDLHDGLLVVEHQPVKSWTALLSGGTKAEAHVTIVVPESVETKVRTVSGDAFVAGIRSSTSISTVSGSITATGLSGEVGLRTVSGDVDVQGVGGTVRTNLVSGDLTISGGDPDELTARAVSGDITLDFDGVPDVDCTTVSGDVAVRLPSDASLRFDAVTVSGRLESGYPDALESGKRRLRGSIGGGGSRRMHVRTTSGDVVLLRRSSATVVEA